MSRRDEALVLYFYGEHEAPEELERGLAADPELARRYEALRRELSTLDTLAPPEPRPGLEGRMWARVAPSLTRPSWRSAWPSSRLAWAALASAVAVVVVVAFLAGRALDTAPTETGVAETLAGLSPAARSRVLQAALADHLESSQRFLLEVANGAPSLDAERATAANLLSASRLYRGAAERAGERRVSALLAELETLLTELSEAPASSGGRLTRARAESEDLLFKIRITRANLKEVS